MTFIMLNDLWNLLLSHWVLSRQYKKPFIKYNFGVFVISSLVGIRICTVSMVHDNICFDW